MPRRKLEVEPLECDPIPLSELEEAVKEIMSIPLSNDPPSIPQNTNWSFPTPVPDVLNRGSNRESSLAFAEVEGAMERRWILD